MDNKVKIHIVGAGVSGLVAARVLEEKGFFPVIIEATDRVGGRVKTDRFRDFQLDHGFQVLLTAYPAAQKYLDYGALDLQRFLPGATVFKQQKQRIIGDPLRNLGLFFPTLFSGIGSFSDKLKIFRLNKRLKRKSVSEIFAAKEKTTLEYLIDLGFSAEIIDDFFKPFFSGIFLETQLATSSRMFEFVYKMFGEGDAAIPKAGIEAIPRQLLQSLKHTTFHFDTKVQSVQEGTILLKNQSQIESDYTIVATEANSLIGNFQKDPISWKSCHTLYFESENRVIHKRLIGLISEKNTLINNIVYHTILETESTSKKELLSVTVIDDKGLSHERLIERVQEELALFCGINVVTFVKHYSIPKALPNITNLAYAVAPSETRLLSTIYLAGDTQLNGSLNAAMISGEGAALGVVEAITNSIS